MSTGTGEQEAETPTLINKSATNCENIHHSILWFLKATRCIRYQIWMFFKSCIEV